MIRYAKKLTSKAFKIQYRQFRLDRSFVQSFESLKPPFGFNGLGELVYLRTYSRPKPNGTNERWHETIERVINGCFSLQEKHFIKNGIEYDKQLMNSQAMDMYKRVFEMKILPPGRGLWAMGSTITEERELYAALNNCGFVSTHPLRNVGYAEPFCFLMDACMLGVGIGFDTRGAGQFSVHKPLQNTTLFVIPDTREGWVDSLRKLLESYFNPNSETVKFDYSKIRPKGEPIKGFGGTTSGPQPLIDLHHTLASVLDKEVNKYVSVKLIVDIMNLIGKTVVAGNVRRTAEIAFGEPDDDEYIKLKDYSKYPERAEYGWTSNNSVFAKLGMNYDKIIDNIIINGEPGFAWLENMKQFGRMKDGNNYKDNVDLVGGNPCLEQTLQNYELCNLVEVFPAKHKDLNDFKESLYLAFLYAKTVTLGEVHWQESKEIMRNNRRIGCSLSGIQQFLAINNYNIEVLKSWCNEGYSFLQHVDNEVSNMFQIEKSIKITSIKPSGTISLVAGATPGLHMPQSRFYIRRVRIGKDSELVKILEKANYDVEDDVYDSNSAVVSFPIDAGQNVRTLNDIDFDINTQLSIAALLQECWADNQVSCTVTFSTHNGIQQTKEDLREALQYFQYKLKGVSFLPHLEEGAYEQMPYETISEEKYLEMQSQIFPPDIPTNFVNSENMQENANFCDSDTCQIAMK